MANAKFSLFTPGVFVLRVCLLGLAGGLVLSYIAYAAGHPYLGKGLLLGSFLSPLQLLTLQSLTNKVIKAGPAKGLGVFRLYNLFRWAYFVLVCWLLVRISVSCLLGGLLSYIWFLLALGWVGFRTALPKKKSPGPGN
jgi:hypothetical protein